MEDKQSESGGFCNTGGEGGKALKGGRGFYTEARERGEPKGFLGTIFRRRE